MAGAETAMVVSVIINAVDRLTAPTRRMAEQMRIMRQQTNLTEEQVARLESRMKNFKKMTLMGAGMTLAGAGMAKGLLSAVDAAGRLQTSMLNVQSALKLTNAEMQKATQLSQTVGIPTMWSSEQMGTIMQTMGNSGLSKSQVLNPALLKSYASFAEIQNWKNGTAPTDSVAAAVGMAHQYQLYSSKQINPFLNNLNAALLHTNSTPSEFATTFKYVSQQARSMGMNANQSLATVAWLDRMGFGNGRGGTNFADFLMRSIYGSSGKKADQAMQAAGFLVHGKSYIPSQYHVGGHYNSKGQLVGGKTIAGHWANQRSVFTDSKGNFVGVQKAAQILQQFSARFGNNANKTSPLLHAIFGTQGGRIAQMMMSKGSTEQYTNVQKQMKNTASIKATQEAYNKSWEGQKKQLVSTMHDLQQVFGQSLMKGILPALSAFNKVTGKLLIWSQKHPTIVKYIATFTSIAAAILLVVGPLTMLVGLFGFLGSAGMVSKGFKEIGKTLKFMFSPLTKLIGLFKNLITFVGKATLQFAKLGAKVIWTTAKFIANAVATVAVKTAQVAVAAASKAWAAIQWVVNAAMDANPIGAITLAVAALILGIIEMVKHWQSVVNVVQSVWSWFGKLWSMIAKFTSGAVSKVLGWFGIGGGGTSNSSSVSNSSLLASSSSTIHIHPGAIQVNGSSNPKATANEVVRQMGNISRTNNMSRSLAPNSLIYNRG